MSKPEKNIRPRNPLRSCSVAATPNWAVFLDVDGTILDIAGRPDLVEASEKLRVTLERLRPHLDGALALVSGRTIADLDYLFAPLTLAAAGQHGLERRDSKGRYHASSAAVPLAAIRPVLETFARAHSGVIVEDKGHTLAIHYRQAPDAETAARETVRRLVMDQGALQVLDGNMVLEIKPKGIDKGRAIAAFMAETPFVNRTPIFIGDHATDEDGFVTVNGMGGHSIRVGDGGATAARFRLDNVGAAIDWLGWLWEDLGRRRGCDP